MTADSLAAGLRQVATAGRRGATALTVLRAAADAATAATPRPVQQPEQ